MKHLARWMCLAMLLAVGCNGSDVEHGVEATQRQLAALEEALGILEAMTDDGSTPKEAEQRLPDLRAAIERYAAARDEVPAMTAEQRAEVARRLDDRLVAAQERYTRVSGRLLTRPDVLLVVADDVQRLDAMLQ